MKRLRKRSAQKIRFFHCGEYGEHTGRPHYHALLFNCDFTDRRKYKKSGDNWIYTSERLDEIWEKGECKFGDVSFESAAYTARYCVKKRTGKGAKAFYTRMDKQTGEVYEIQPEYATMSRRPRS